MSEKGIKKMIQQKIKKRMWSNVCEMCGTKFESVRVTGTKFCSNVCGQRYRREKKRWLIWDEARKHRIRTRVVVPQSLSEVDEIRVGVMSNANKIKLERFSNETETPQN
jgi:hypothetical protein